MTLKTFIENAVHLMEEEKGAEAAAKLRKEMEASHVYYSETRFQTFNIQRDHMLILCHMIRRGVSLSLMKIAI
jgi:hypothetical protein